MPRASAPDHDNDKPKVNIAGTVPPDPANGLLAILGELVADPGRRRLAIVEFDMHNVKRITDTGQQIPTVRIRQIEPVRGREQEDQAAKLLREAMGERGAQLTLDAALDQ